jgi:lipopolysaccharide export LptBFGC system permease protein LptF
MRTILVVLFAAVTFGFVHTGVAWAQGYSPKLEIKQLKARQKAERKALKLRQKYTKQSWKNQNVSKAVRIQMKHQMQREERELREKQKDERQDLKDQQRLLKERQQ